MPAGVSAYVALANVTLGSSTSIVSFTSISQSYRDLVFIINISGLTGTPTNIGSIFRINGDSGANYGEVEMTGTGSAASSGGASGQNQLPLPSSESSTPSMTKLDFLDYSATDKHKTILTRGDRPDNRTTARAGRWASTSAITSVTFYAPDYFAGTVDTWNAGSTFALYGIAS
jgi:hypothetical protein